MEGVAIEYDKLCDLVDEYFTELRRYNRMLAAPEIGATELLRARAMEAENWSRVQKAKQKLKEHGIEL